MLAFVMIGPEIVGHAHDGGVYNLKIRFFLDFPNCRTLKRLPTFQVPARYRIIGGMRSLPFPNENLPCVVYQEDANTHIRSVSSGMVHERSFK